MCHRGFTHQELRDIFGLDPDRLEDRSTIAALQASSARLRVPSPAPAGHRSVRSTVRQLLSKHSRQARRAAGPSHLRMEGLDKIR